MDNNNSINKEIKYLRSLPSIREKAGELFELGTNSDSLPNFSIDLSKLPLALSLVEECMQENYPDGVDSVPFHSRWRHFEHGDSNRVKDKLLGPWNQLNVDPKEQSRKLIDLAVISVLLDAGAGAEWSFIEPGTNKKYTRSEGLGIASFHMFLSGAFSLYPENEPHRVDAEKLINLPGDAIEKAFQVDAEKNPLVGCKGRADLLNKLGKCLSNEKQYFENKIQGTFRPGNIVDYLWHQVSDSSKSELSVTYLWDCILIGFSKMWPTNGRKVENGQNLGDVWFHSSLSKNIQCNSLSQLIPFHKLTQWLIYSLVEPLAVSGLKILNLNWMTGLPEYRNGGLFVDTQVLVPKKVLRERYLPSDEIIVEWRALTIVLLDKLYELWKDKYKIKNEEDFPMVKLLQAGTWTAGRKIAKKLRPKGTPPIQIQSDGTVF